ncbi:MAG: hypothetical protein R3C56_28240 [Pirellulaceae bacterium]
MALAFAGHSTTPKRLTARSTTREVLWSRQTQIDVVQVAARPELYAEFLL